MCPLGNDIISETCQLSVLLVRVETAGHDKGLLRFETLAGHYKMMVLVDRAIGVLYCKATSVAG